MRTVVRPQIETNCSPKRDIVHRQKVASSEHGGVRVSGVGSKTVNPEGLFSREELLATMSMGFVTSWLIGTKPRRSVSTEAHQETVHLALGCPIAFNPRPLREVLVQAVKQYNSVNAGDILAGRKTAVTLEGNDRYMIRRVNVLAVQYIRHQLTNYDSLWRAFEHRPGGWDAWQIFFRKSAEMMKLAYPQLESYIDSSVTWHAMKIESLAP